MPKFQNKLRNHSSAERLKQAKRTICRLFNSTLPGPILLVLALSLTLILPGIITKTSSSKTQNQQGLAEQVFANVISQLQPTPQGTTQARIQTGSQTNLAGDPQPTNCNFAMPDKPVYAGRFISIKKQAAVAAEEAFQIQIMIENTGNVPWFSAESGCPGVKPLFLGTAKDRDRASPFAADASLWDSHWVATNRIKMDNKRVSPLQVATFSFWAKAPKEEGYYREFFAPVVEGIGWIEKEALFSFDIKVGNFELSDKQKQYMPYIQKSANLTAFDLNGEKKIEVSLKNQKMLLKIGSVDIRSFPVSTGSYKHPTPTGTFSISLKQDVRVGSEKPHYIMPKFMMFLGDGHGIHALPSLGNDHGVFWREALNHIGEPRSHGCIRLLPEDADFVFNFAELGTKLVINK